MEDFILSGFNSVIATFPVWGQAMAYTLVSLFTLYRVWLKPKVAQKALQGVISIDASRALIIENTKWRDELNQLKSDLLDDQRENLRDRLRTLRYTLRDEYETSLNSRMEDYVCPNGHGKCVMKRFIIESSVNAYIGILLTITTRVFREMESVVKRNGYHKKDRHELREMSDTLSDQFIAMGKDVMRDFYPTDSIIPMQERLAYVDEKLDPKVRELVYDTIVETKNMRADTYDQIKVKTDEYHDKIHEIYGGKSWE